MFRVYTIGQTVRRPYTRAGPLTRLPHAYRVNPAGRVSHPVRTRQTPGAPIVTVYDIHPHVLAPDAERYPLARSAANSPAGPHPPVTRPHCCRDG